jgi:hypothetical protein
MRYFARWSDVGFTVFAEPFCFVGRNASVPPGDWVRLPDFENEVFMERSIKNVNKGVGFPIINGTNEYKKVFTLWSENRPNINRRES